MNARALVICTCAASVASVAFAGVARADETIVPNVGARASAAADASSASASDDGVDRSVDETGFALGAVSMLVTTAIGGTFLSRGDGPALRNVGANIAGFGFAAAPFVAHIPSGEYLRGAAFSATPLAMAAGNATLLAIEPNTVDEQGSVKTRVPFALFVTFGMVSGIVGIVDAAFASGRQPTCPTSPSVAASTASTSSTAFVPSISTRSATLSWGGSF